MQCPFVLDWNVLNHLGVGLYTSTPAVLTELIANAYDADAPEVKIDFDIEGGEIRILDNGHGMDVNALKDQFFTVGYQRRLHSELETTPGGRYPMGRKGLGKLAIFSLASEFAIYSKMDGGEEEATRVVREDLEEKIRINEPYETEDLGATNELGEQEKGTLLVLTQLTNSITEATLRHLRGRIVRRFTVLSDKFQVIIDGTALDRSDKEFEKDIQCLWYLDDTAQQHFLDLGTVGKYGPDEKNCMEEIPNEIPCGDSPLRINGYIGTVKEPKQLKRYQENINQVSIFANGRVFEENVLSRIGGSKHVYQYIYGEIEADFLDRDNTDRAVTNREGIKKEDQIVSLLVGYIKEKILPKIDVQWDDWRAKLGYGESAEEINPTIASWIDTLEDARDKELADTLMSKISSARFSADEQENLSQQKHLYKSAVLGFERLRNRNQLSRLDQIPDVVSPEFQSIFRLHNDLEESFYYDITTGRLRIIERLKEIHKTEQLEKIAEIHLFDNLWLLDPTWGRITGSEQMEQTLSDVVRNVEPDDDKSARLDIAYRTSSGRHIIVELKRPGLPYNPADLIDQGGRYKEAVKEWYKQHPDAYDRTPPPIDVYFLVEKDLFTNETQQQLLDVLGYVLTYAGLIENAFKAYGEYLSSATSLGRINTIIDEIGD